MSRVEAAETAGRERVSVADVVAALKQPPPATSTLRTLAEQLAASPRRDLAGTMHLGDTTIAVRVERSGDTVYALEVRDETVNFVVLGGSTEPLSTLYQRIEEMLTA
ncbi:hypothetical protein [Lentzea flava]|uniref:EspG family protein n=1 Tax=Lentzea flava TaxID=103732 RepID=A0ABQ2UJ63_9PSEU|nr:hypothetical protein [Lentzea flava]MCP2199909.1 hypothetical protein [Lentzea flava]GGU40039.1 hypothetical protein GCM10010178_35530 [Lentzea flava]